MKNLLLLLFLGLVSVPAALGRSDTPTKALPAACPADYTLRFSQIYDSDLPTGVEMAPTKCAKVVYLSSSFLSCQGCTFTTTFSNGNPAPKFLPSSSTQNGGFFPLGAGQTVVTVTGSNGQSCSYRVTLEDDEAPVLDAPDEIKAKKTNIMPDLRNVVNVDENCDYTLTQSPAAGRRITGNSVLVTFTATDASGNSSQTSLTLVLVNSNPFDKLAVSMSNACDPQNLVAKLSGLPPSSTFIVVFKLNGVNGEQFPSTDESGQVTLLFGNGAVYGQNTLTIVSVNDFSDSGVSYFVNKTATAKAGLTLASAPTVSGVPVCAGSDFTLTFTVSCTGYPGNTRAQLSNASGSFASGTTDLGPVEPGSHSLLIPGDVPAGAGYRVQITATATFMDGRYSAPFRIRACDAPPGTSRLAAETSAEEPTGLQVSVSPNPTGGQLRVRMQSAVGQALKVELFNGAGQSIRQQNVERALAEESLNWDISRQAPGLYLLRVSSGKEAKTVKVIR